MKSNYLLIGIIVALLILIFNTCFYCKIKNIETLENMNIDWKSGLRCTHYYDCGGQACDAKLLQPFDLSKFIAGPGYTVLDPNDFGGPVYGEKMWIYGAASDSFAEILGDNVSGLGEVSEGPVSGACGKSILVKNPSAKNSDWIALVMRKNRCPPWSSGCDEPHMDLMIPGFDYLTKSTAKRCGDPGTGLTKEQSSICGNLNSPSECESCDKLPSTHKKGCQLFVDWGWSVGNPKCDYAVVETPKAFIEYTKLIQIGGKYQNDPDQARKAVGAKSSATPPSTKPPSTKPPSTKPPSTKPPSARPPSAIPPSTKPPSTKPPGATPPSATPPTRIPKDDLASCTHKNAKSGGAPPNEMEPKLYGQCGGLLPDKCQTWTASCPPASKCNYDPAINLYYGQCLPSSGNTGGSNSGNNDECTPNLVTKCCNGSAPLNLKN